jgi:hypothetical protein
MTLIIAINISSAFSALDKVYGESYKVKKLLDVIVLSLIKCTSFG